jgi:hypothetical protein
MSYIIKNFQVFKTECSKFDKQALKAMLWHWALQRTIEECVLVDMFNECNKDGVINPKSKTFASYANTLEGERILISLLGRKEAAKVYGMLEGITSDVKTVDYVLENDSVQYYQKLISASDNQKPTSNTK